MTNLTPAEVFPPGEFLRDELSERGWSEAEFADILSRPVQAISEILNGKKEITAETAVAISAALDTSPEVWLNLQSAYRLQTVRTRQAPATDVERRAALRELVPVRELQKRRWLPDTKDLDVLEAAVCEFLDIDALGERPTFAVAARRTNATEDFNPEQRAWIARIRSIGERSVRAQFDPVGLGELAGGVVQRLRNPSELIGLHQWLEQVGVVLVTELPLRSSKIDGVAMIGPEGTPIIGLSTRGDRFDGFVFTLLHEIAHVILGHVKAAGDLTLDEEVGDDGGDTIEKQANALAGEWVLPGKLELEKTEKPTMREIIGIAQSRGVHPSFVIGRLQRDEVLDWSDFRRSVPKVRPFVLAG